MHIGHILGLRFDVSLTCDLYMRIQRRDRGSGPKEQNRSSSAIVSDLQQNHKLQVKSHMSVCTLLAFIY